MGRWPHCKGPKLRHMRFLLIKWKQQTADLTQTEAERRCSPTVFFYLSAHIKQRYPSHPLPPIPLHPLRTSGCGFIGDSKSSKSTRAEKSTMLRHIPRKRGDSASILFASVLMANEKGRGEWSSLQPHIPFTNVCPQFHQVHSSLYVRITVMW